MSTRSLLVALLTVCGGVACGGLRCAAVAVAHRRLHVQPSEAARTCSMLAASATCTFAHRSCMPCFSHSDAKQCQRRALRNAGPFAPALLLLQSQPAASSSKSPSSPTRPRRREAHPLASTVASR
jgi:hypothetical protein